MKNLLILALLACCSFRAAQAGNSPALDAFIASTDAVASSDRTTREKSDAVSAQYDAHFPAQTAAIPNDALGEFFKATDYLLFYSMDKTRLPRLEQIFARLADAGEATPEHYRTVLHTYFALREFDKANALMARHGPMLLPNRPFDAEDRSSPRARRTAWFFQGQRRLTRRDVEIGEGVHLVVIGSPHCHFAANALSEIGNDPALRSLLASKVTVIAMNEFSLNADVYAAWNAAYPALPFRLAHNREEWPEVSQWASPVFLFFENGKLKSRFSGWPAAGQMDKIHQGFGLAAASDPSAPSR